MQAARTLVGLPLAAEKSMMMTNSMARWGGMKLSRRLSRSLPWIGTAVALATIVSTVRRKGVISGTLDTGLNAVPYVGAAKNVVEMARGRDFFPDRYPERPGVARRRR
jgi:hypothetical protein